MGSHSLADYFAGFSLTDEEKIVRSESNHVDIRDAVKNRISKEYPNFSNLNIPIEEVRKLMNNTINATRIENKNMSRLKAIYPPRINAMVAQRLYSKYIIDIYQDNALDDIQGFKTEDKSAFSAPTRLKAQQRIYAVAGQGDMNR